MHIFNTIKKSFATKLSLQIVTFAAIVLLASNGIIGAFTSKTLIRDTDEHASDKLKIVTSKIKIAMSEIAINTYENTWDIIKSHNDTAALAREEREFLQLTPEAYGCAIEFVPGYGNDIPFIYSHKSADGLNAITQSADSSNIDTPWFKRAIELGEPIWTDPHTIQADSNAKSEPVITYCLPIKSRNKAVGVLSIDMPIQWFSDLITDPNDPYNWLISLIAADGTIISHPNKKYLLKSIDSLTGNGSTKFLGSIGQKASGIVKMKVDGSNYYVYYKRLKKTGWIVTVSCLEQDLLQEYSSLTRMINIVILTGLTILLVFSIWLIRRNVKPLTELAKAAEKIASGDFADTGIKMRRTDEMGQLYQSFANMRASLTKHIEELKSRTALEAKINSELRAAHNIQQSIIRKNLPEHDGMDVCAILRPAKEIGGDLYDYMTIGDKLYFAIADVSGKGVPAALVMANTMGMFRSLARNELTPSQIISGINDTLADNNDSNMFVTMFVGMIDLTSGHMTYCNAGHTPPLIIDGNGVTELPVYNNLAMGIFGGKQFADQECDSVKGKTIFTYTDGVTEAEDSENRLFGNARLTETLAHTTGMTASKIIECVDQAVAQHVNGAKQSDDLTMLCIKLPNGSNPQRLRITNRVSELHKLKEFVDNICNRAGIDKGTCESLNLAMEEAVVNVVMYAYDKGVDGNIDITARIMGSELEFTITDNGKEFDPTQKEDADVTLPLEERTIGGLGVFIMKKIMDGVVYNRAGDKNVLRLTKRIGAAQ